MIALIEEEIILELIEALQRQYSNESKFAV